MSSFSLIIIMWAEAKKKEAEEYKKKLFVLTR